MKIINCRFSNNITYPILLKENGIPEYYTMMYCLTFLKSKTLKTKKNNLVSIKLFYHYLEEKYQNDYFEKIRNGEIINELDNYFHWLFHKKNDSKTNKMISNQLFDIHINSIKNFLEWNFIKFKLNKNLLIELKNKITINNIHLPSSKREYKYLSEIEINNLKNIVSITSEINPFNKELKLRNYLIIEILLQTGFRISELLLLRIENIVRSDSNYYLQIKKDDNNLEDTRKIKPSIKNNWSYRIVSISHELYHLIDIYISKFRKQIVKKNKVKNGYLLISTNGNPIDLKTINYIFQSIKTSYKTRFHHEITFSPHIIRHTFVNQFLEYLIDYEKIDMELAKDKLRNICGWSISSPMPTYYAAKFINSRANEINLNRINNIDYEV